MNFDFQIFCMSGMKTNEAVTENEDGSYTIFINDNLCDSKKRAAIYHALLHIKNNDFGKDDVQNIEIATHRHAYH